MSMTEMDRDERAETSEDDAYALNRETVNAILEAVRAGDAPLLTGLMEPLHAADIADLLEQLSEPDREALVRLYDREFDGEILSELGEGIREEVIGYLRPEVLAEAVRELDSDDVVDILEDVSEPEQQTAILEALDEADRVAVEQSMSYAEESAGRLMQREVVWMPEHLTVGEAIDHMRSQLDLPDQFYHVVLVDPRHRPVANVTLGRIMSSDRPTKLAEIAEPTFHVIPVTQDEEDVAYAFNQYHLISAPVVDDTGRLVGVITIDDAMIVLGEEHEEDILLMAGLGAEEEVSDRVRDIARARFVWLAVNLVTAIFASIVIAQFAETIEAVVALAVLMPIVASMGGNAGTQSMTVAVRSLATRDLTGQNARRVILREVAVGAINGFGFGIIMAIVAAVWFGIPMLPVVIAIAMLLTLVAAAMGGIVIPILLDRFGIDPALASGPFVTTVTDVVGFFAFLGLAATMLL